MAQQIMRKIRGLKQVILLSLNVQCQNLDGSTSGKMGVDYGTLEFSMIIKW